MRDWPKELPPGTLVVSRATGEIGCVINVKVTMYPGPWTSLSILMLISDSLRTVIISDALRFYDDWFKVMQNLPGGHRYDR